MTGVRLVTNVHIVTGDTTSIHNLVMCCNRAGLEVADIVLESLASANAVLSREEMDLGVGLLDIGGGTSDLAIFSGGIRQPSDYPWVTNLITLVGQRCSILDTR